MNAQIGSPKLFVWPETISHQGRGCSQTDEPTTVVVRGRAASPIRVI